MSFNAKQLPKTGAKNTIPNMEPGSYPARLVQLINMGVQTQRPYKGEEKPPRLMVRLTYEFLDEFLKDDDDNDLEDKPRWLSEELPFMSLKQDLAKSTKRYYALDPEDTADGDWTELVARPCMVTVVNDADKRPGIDRIYDKIASVSAMRPKEAAKAPELKNPSLIWDFYSPDVEVFNKFPEWLQEKIKSAVDYEGSALEKALTGAVASKGVDGGQEKAKAPKAAPKAPVEEDEEAW